MNNHNNFSTGVPNRHPLGIGAGGVPPGGQLRQNMGQQNYQNRGIGQGGTPGPNQFQTSNNMPPQMMGPGMRAPQPPPEQPKPQKLKINLSNKERGFYSNMISKLETDDSNRIDGKQAVTFFKTSGVDLNILKAIYRI